MLVVASGGLVLMSWVEQKITGCNPVHSGLQCKKSHDRKVFSAILSVKFHRNEKFHNSSISDRSDHVSEFLEKLDAQENIIKKINVCSRVYLIRNNMNFLGDGPQIVMGCRSRSW